MKFANTHLQSHATLFSASALCHPRFSSFACTERGIRRWYVSGTSRAQSSHSDARVLDHTGGGAVASGI